MRQQIALLAALIVSRGAVRAQQPSVPAMGSVSTTDAKVAGGLEVDGARAHLLSNASVTALDHTASVSLARGGEILVCATSQFHLLRSGVGSALVFGLDRGALQMRTRALQDDVLMTPDIRFTVETAGTLDLSLRVTRNGDTCVENAGANAPTLLLNDAFSPAVYRLTPGQHVLFEHGSLREVVDNETSPCGCPAPPVQLATVAPPAPASPAQQAAVEHPFPEAASQDLAPTPAPPLNAAPDTAPHAQISSTLTYTPGQPPPAASAPAAAMPVDNNAAAVPYATPNGTVHDAGPPPETPPAPRDLWHAIGRFFHKLFKPGDRKPAPATQ